VYSFGLSQAVAVGAIASRSTVKLDCTDSTPMVHRRRHLITPLTRCVVL